VLLDCIRSAGRRLVLSLFRCNDFGVLDALAEALERGCQVEVILTKRAKGGRKRLRKLWGALEEMGAVVTWYSDAVVKYHAKYVVADEGPAIITTLNMTRKCFTRTWDCLLVTEDPSIVKSLHALFEADSSGTSISKRFPVSDRLIVGPEHSRREIRRLIGGATRSIRILDHKLSDPDVVALLRERRADGVAVSVLGRELDGFEPHGKMMIVDDSVAVMGSMALSTLSLDFRREVSVLIDNPALVRQLNVMYRELSARSRGALERLPGDRVR
jgi:phosphatidylserine/phosphatidylglycerophosphate/cardiolipin synthase-like enzyme